MPVCSRCGASLRVGDWPYCADSTGRHGHLPPHGRLSPLAAHPRERTVLYRHPATGKLLYPGRNDAPMPANYASQGYENWEPSVDDMRKLERESGIVNHALNYDSNGTSLDQANMRTPEPMALDPNISIISKTGSI